LVVVLPSRCREFGVSWLMVEYRANWSLRASLFGLAPVRDRLGLVAGDRIRIELDTWTRQAKVERVAKHADVS